MSQKIPAACFINLYTVTTSFMNPSSRTFISWSGGKDSSLSLLKAQQQGLPVDALLTAVNTVHHRISMHGVRRRLLEIQAASLQLPLYTLDLAEEPGMEDYEREVNRVYTRLKEDGFTQGIFGDIFLEDLKAYREAQLARWNIKGLFPLWKKDSRVLMHEFFDAGFQAVVVCVNTRFLDKSFCGRLLTPSFLQDLPDGVDPCGENGEYHTFVFDGPLFSRPVLFSKGEMVYRSYKSPGSGTQSEADTGFWFCDLLPCR